MRVECVGEEEGEGKWEGEWEGREEEGRGRACLPWRTM